jgi:hypothetical protein
MSDSVEIKVKKEGDDFAPLIFDLLKSIDYKYYAFMFLFFMFITSDIFINKLLSNIEGTLEYQNTTPYGIVIQAITLIGIMIIIQMLIKKEII